MRVIAGKYKSRRLVGPTGQQTRPTSDRLRETLFNVVAAKVPGSAWLDLFAGTGAVGIEAISRGARLVCFVESSSRAARTIRSNLAALEITEGYEIIEREAPMALRMLDLKGAVYDFCYLDPPYRKMNVYEEVLAYLSRARLLSQEGTVIAEHDKHFDPGEAYGSLRRQRKLRQGDSVLSFYQRTKNLGIG
jgi:16S rRNA (guanine(966)-N(2))-methyltransferase RsmD